MLALWVWLAAALSASALVPPGRLVDAGGHKLHLNCAGKRGPTVVVETGLRDSSSDWILVQRSAAAFVRICTYDRAGYAWSEPGPEPRTYAQINFELRKALAAAGERGPFVLVGHSFGGGVIRQHALSHASDVAGLVFVDIVGEHQYIRMGPHAGRIGDDAKGREIPAPREGSGPGRPLLEEVENSQREWSAEYYARWAAAPQKGSLGSIPLVVLTRAEGGYGNKLDKSEEELERARLEAQRALAELSSAGTQRIVKAGHNMHLEAPDVVVQAIRDVVAAARR